MEIIRHFTATTYIVHKNKTLMHLHKKLGVWLPVGGHIDENETPEEAALREIKEESGLVVKLYNPNPPIEYKDAKELLSPMHIVLEYIAPGHEHMDFIFYAKSDTDKLNPGDGETDHMEWLTAEEISKLENIPDNAKQLAYGALETMKDK